MSEHKKPGKTEAVVQLLALLKLTSLTNEQRDAVRSAINTLVWLIERRAKYSAHKKLAKTTETEAQ